MLCHRRSPEIKAKTYLQKEKASLRENVRSVPDLATSGSKSEKLKLTKGPGEAQRGQS